MSSDAGETDEQSTPESAYDWRWVAVAGAVVLLVALAAAFSMGLFAGDSQPSPAGGTATPRPTSGTPTPGTVRPIEGSAFSFTVDKIDKCGTRCRDVTVTLTNTGNDSASNVNAVTRIYTGKKKIWEGEEAIGTLDAGSSATRTERVKIGYLDAIRIQRNNGYIRIETTVTWSGGSTTFVDRRKVA